MANGQAGVLLRTRSVHGVGLSQRLLVMAVDDRGWIVARRLLRPTRVLFVASARWMAEFPPPGGCPGVGNRVTLELALG